MVSDNLLLRNKRKPDSLSLKRPPPTSTNQLTFPHRRLQTSRKHNVAKDDVMAILACVSLGAWASTLEDGACLVPVIRLSRAYTFVSVQV